MKEQGITTRIDQQASMEKPVLRKSDPTVVFAAEVHRGSVSEPTYRRHISHIGSIEGLNLIKDIKEQQPVDWEALEGEPLLFLLQSIEGRIPVTFIDARILEARHPILRGRSIRPLYDLAAKKCDKEGGQRPVEYLLEKAGVEMTVEDIGFALDAHVHDPWGKVKPVLQHTVLELASIEREKPTREFIEDDFNQEYDFLHGHPLSGLHAKYNSDKKRGIQPTIPYLLEQLGYQKYTETEVLSLIEQEKRIRWAQVSPQAFRELIYLVTLGEKSPYLATFIDLHENKHFLHGNNLGSMYDYWRRRKDRGDRHTIEFMFEEIGMYDNIFAPTKELKPKDYEELFKRFIYYGVSFDKMAIGLGVTPQRVITDFHDMILHDKLVTARTGIAERHKQIITMHREGMKRAEIARSLGINPLTITNDYEVLGLTRHRDPHRHSEKKSPYRAGLEKARKMEQRKAVIKKEFEEGKLRTADIAKKYNISVALVNSYIRQLKDENVIPEERKKIPRKKKNRAAKSEWRVAKDKEISERIERIKEYLRQGREGAYIARELGVSEALVSRHIKKL